MEPIHICSRSQALQATDTDHQKSLCISVGSSGQEDARLVGGLTGKFARVLRLRFDDVEDQMGPAVTFGRVHAQQILDAVRELPADAPLMIHCEGGVSRSVAIGYFLATLLRRRARLHAAPDCSKGNRLVFKTLRNAYVLDAIARWQIPRLDLLRLELPRSDAPY